MYRTIQHFRATSIPSIFILIGSVGLLFILTFGWTAPTHAAVTLVSFDGEYVEDPDVAIEITWNTASEIGTAGFILKRSINGGPEEDLTVLYSGSEVTFIGAKGESTASIYEVTDFSVQAGDFYQYTLYEQEINNEDLVWAGQVDISATLGGGSVGIGTTSTPIPTSSFTPTPAQSESEVTNTPSPTSNATFQATSTPATTTSATDVATATVESAVTATVESTATPIPTAASSNEEGTGSGESTVNSEETGSTVDETTNADPLTDSEAGTEPAAEEEEFILGDGSVEAAEIEQYPEPTVVDSSTESTEEAAESGDPEGYVPPIESEDQTESNGLNAKPIASDVEIPQEDAETTSAQAEVNQSTNNNRLILWGSFIASMVMFITGVIGAIYMFRQKQG